MEAAAAVLAADSLEDTLRRMAHRLQGLVPYDDLALYELVPSAREFRPVFAVGTYADEVLAERVPVDEGITGAVLRERRTRNIARVDLHPMARVVTGTSAEPEALVCVPLFVERGALGALNVYRAGEDASFSSAEAEVIERFATMAALAFDAARQREVLREQAATDGLTGLLNKRASHEQLERALERARESGAPLSVVVVDLDHFKAINDTYGHAEGDKALRAVADRLRAVVRAGDQVGRLGGEEFALILPGASAAQAVATAERVRAAVAALQVGDRHLTVSAGVATLPTETREPLDLLELADAALYAAKRGGRDQTRRFHPASTADRSA